MRGVNRVTLIGNVGRDAELRYTAQGTPVASFSLAVNHKRADGQEETQWFSVVCWSKLAEIAAEWVTKGRGVYVDGRLRTRLYADRNGVERTAVEVIAGELVLLPDGRGKGEAAAEPAVEPEPGVDAGEVPF